MSIWKALFFGIILLTLVLVMPPVFADTWYVGKGLKQGDFFSYNVCYADYHNCNPFEIDFWVRNQTYNGNWNLQFHTLDGNISQTGMVTVGANFANPINYSSNLADYVNTFKNTVSWLHLFANNESPKDFSNPVWNHDSGRSIGPISQQEKVTVKAGTFDAWIIGWHRGLDNKIWVAPNMPFPVKAQTWVDCACGKPPPLFTFEMLETGNSKTEPTWNMSQTSSSQPTPLHQSKLGITVSKVTCRIGFELVIKKSDNSPACVKPDTAQKLVERGWGTILLNDTQKFVIINTDAGKSSKAYNASMINQIQNTINGCTNSKIHLGYGLGSENIVLTQVNETCNVSISGETEMGTFSYTCNVPLENMDKWVHWKDMETPPSPDDIMGFCKRTH